MPNKMQLQLGFHGGDAMGPTSPRSHVRARVGKQAPGPIVAYLTKDETWVTREGPYRWIRHPLQDGIRLIEQEPLK